MTREPEEFASAQFIRARLYGGDTSTVRRYRELVVGPGSTWRLLWHELLTTLVGELPGAIGLALRRVLYPTLFRKCGRGVVFGKSLVIRNAQNIEIGDGVLVDDFCLLEGRGGAEEPVTIGDRVILNRGVVVQAKIGTIRIGEDCDIGAGCTLVSQGGVHLGRRVSLGGNCDIGGGVFSTEAIDPADAAGDAAGDGPKHRKLTRGAVRIGDDTVTGMGVLVLDNVTIGSGCIVGGGAVVRESIPDGTVATPHQRLILLPREPAPTPR